MKKISFNLQLLHFFLHLLHILPFYLEFGRLPFGNLLTSTTISCLLKRESYLLFILPSGYDGEHVPNSKLIL
jgi:hypothetical protein